MSDFREQCESSFYRELYHIEGKNQRILLNTVTGRQYLEKTLDVYDLRVYEFLRVNRNIHIPAVESCTVRDGKLVVLEDYVNGETLTNALRRGLPEPERRRVVLEVCDALQFLHAANPPIIHRDVKADNIILTPDGVVKLIDYDAATVFDPTKTADTVLMGTPGAAAPEQYGFARSDARTDIFALGMLIKQILPNDAEYIAAADVATRMDPNARWQSIEEMKNALTHKQSKQKRTPRVSARIILSNKWFWIVCFAVVICLFYFLIMKEAGKILQSSLSGESPIVHVSAEGTTLPASESNGSEDSSDIRDSVRAEIDAYEAFIDEYCAFMSKYKTGGNSNALAADYSEFIKKYNDWVKNIDLLKLGLSSQELKYYNETVLRCIKKLNEIG